MFCTQWRALMMPCVGCCGRDYGQDLGLYGHSLYEGPGKLERGDIRT